MDYVGLEGPPVKFGLVVPYNKPPSHYSVSEMYVMFQETAGPCSEARSPNKAFCHWEEGPGENLQWGAPHRWRHPDSDGVGFRGPMFQYWELGSGGPQKCMGPSTAELLGTVVPTRCSSLATEHLASVLAAVLMKQNRFVQVWSLHLHHLLRTL